MNCWVTIRGGLAEPAVLLVDLEAGVVQASLVLPVPVWSGVPSDKNGTAGIAWHGPHLVIATWDSLVTVDPTSGTVVEVVTDRCFSDLHGIHMEPDGSLWVASSNLDAALHVRDGAVVERVFADERVAGEVDANGVDYRTVLKADTAIHQFHVNDVWVSPERLVMSFLGRRARRTVRWRVARKLGRADTMSVGSFGYRMRDGGVRVLDRADRSVRVVPGEGLHDLADVGGGVLWSTEYFGGALRRFDSATGTSRRILLRPGPPDGYLTRGILEDGAGGFWLGHTVRRDEHDWSELGDRPGLLRRYSATGEWSGDEVAIPGHPGIFALAPALPPA